MEGDRKGHLILPVLAQPCIKGLRSLLLFFSLPGDMLPQYIVKPSRSRLSAFAWHRDSAWCSGSDVEYHPYLSIWVALDDAHAGALVSAAPLSSPAACLC